MNNDVISPEFDENGRPLRRIRSFVRRQGRLTKGQQHALDNYWPVMGVEFAEQPLDFAALFGNNGPVTLEIGFGMGASLVEMAKTRPEQNFLGIEVHSPGVGACLSSAHEEGVGNLRVMCHDAVEVLHKMIPDNSLNMVQLFFPDPWHKAFLPRQRCRGRPEVFFKQRHSGVVNIARFGSGDNLRLRGHDATQRAKLLLQQRQLFGYFNQHAGRGSRQFAQAVQESHRIFVHSVQTQVMARSLLRDK